MSFAAVLERLRKVENPYPGMRPFETEEAHLYYGRDPQIAELLRRLERHRFLAIVGVSGSGKSSLVLAGLIPALTRRAPWRIIRMRPQADPYSELSSAASLDPATLRASSFGLINALAEISVPVLLIVDQFEEIFRYQDYRGLSSEQKSNQAALSADFVQLLLSTSAESRNISVVITMRSDYLGACAEFRALPEAINGAQYLVPRLTREQLTEAIKGPLGTVPIAPALAQQLLNDLGDDPGRLPLLQHALMRTWNRWKQDDPNGSRPIDLSDYQNIGRIEGALDQHADELLQGLPEDLARIVFQRLTARSSDQRERRDPAAVAELSELCQSSQLNEVLDRFRLGQATFLTPRDADLTPDTYIDITHESLIWNWTKLKQ
jgi:energy-coupling factor transporter ATP-binding protein EcfA2